MDTVKNYRYADLARKNLIGIDLSNRDLSYCDLEFTNLRYANLTNSDLTNTLMHGTDLRFADLTNAVIDPQYFDKVKFAQCKPDDKFLKQITIENPTPIIFSRSNCELAIGDSQFHIDYWQYPNGLYVYNCPEYEAIFLPHIDEILEQCSDFIGQK